MVRKKKLKFKKLSLQKILIYALVTVILIVIWSALAVIVKALAVVYLGYRAINLALEGFSDNIATAHLIIAIILVALAFIVSSTAFLVLVIILMWLNAFLDD